MKNIAVLLLLAFASLSCSSVAQDKKLINPGEGVGELQLGMKQKKVKKLLGDPENKRAAREERQAYEDGGYKPDDFLVFRMGFDECWQYGNNKADYPVFKVYFKDKKVCYIVLSGASFGSVRAGIFVTKEGIGFNSKKTDVLNVFGQDYRFLDMANYDGEYIYQKKGISFVVENDESIISMDIYSANPREMRVKDEGKTKNIKPK